MKVIAEIWNVTRDGADQTKKVTLSETPVSIPKITYRKGDILFLQSEIVNDGHLDAKVFGTVKIRIEDWDGNDIIKALGRDIPSHISEEEVVVKVGEKKNMGLMFSVVPRDNDATIIVGTQIDYAWALHREVKTQLVVS